MQKDKKTHSNKEQPHMPHDNDTQETQTKTESDTAPQESQVSALKENTLLPDFIQERFSLLQETITKFEKEAKENIKKLIEKGEHAQEDGTKIVQSFLKKTKLSKEDIEKRIEVGMEKLLGSLNLPTKHDIEKLNSRLDNINKKLNNLKKQETAPKSTAKSTAKRPAASRAKAKTPKKPLTQEAQMAHS